MELSGYTHLLLFLSAVSDTPHPDHPRKHGLHEVYAYLLIYGQSYLEYIDEKIEEFIQNRKKYHYEIVVDGGISEEKKN